MLFESVNSGSSGSSSRTEDGSSSRGCSQRRSDWGEGELGQQSGWFGETGQSQRKPLTQPLALHGSSRAKRTVIYTGENAKDYGIYSRTVSLHRVQLTAGCIPLHETVRSIVANSCPNWCGWFLFASCEWSLGLTRITIAPDWFWCLRAAVVAGAVVTLLLLWRRECPAVHEQLASHQMFNKSNWQCMSSDYYRLLFF